MQKTLVDNIIEFLKQQGLVGVLCLLLVYFFGTFSTQLADIQKEMLEIKIQLAKMEEKYAEKQAVRDMITNAIQKLQTKYHSNK